jgi:hypothetical protein
MLAPRLWHAQVVVNDGTCPRQPYRCIAGPSESNSAAGETCSGRTPSDHDGASTHVLSLRDANHVPLRCSPN